VKIVILTVDILMSLKLFLIDVILINILQFLIFNLEYINIYKKKCF